MAGNTFLSDKSFVLALKDKPAGGELVTTHPEVHPDTAAAEVICHSEKPTKEIYQENPHWGSHFKVPC